ncbi:hypothetical protein ACKKBG_A31095 [Auxenochlorella protothecoides x Auxenochlorella symbiontica]
MMAEDGEPGNLRDASASESESDAGSSSYESTPRSLDEQPECLARPSFGLPSLRLQGLLDDRGSRGADLPQPTTSRPIQFDVISSAFCLPATETIAARKACSQKLGVSVGRLTLYGLHELPSSGQIPPSCRRVAIDVQGSDLSLAALEGLLRDSHTASSISKPPDSDAELAGLKSKLSKLEKENQDLRSMVKLLESLRKRGQCALRDIKREFDVLVGELGPAAHELSASKLTPVALTHALMDAA